MDPFLLAGLASGFEKFCYLEADPHEKKSLIDDPAYRDTIRSYRRRLAELQEQAR